MPYKTYEQVYKKIFRYLEKNVILMGVNFSGDISDDNESSSIENSLSCPNFVLAGGKKYCL